MRVKTSDIIFEQDCYPRGGLDNEYLRLLQSTDWEQLPPIVLSKDMLLIDGYHRLTLAKMQQLAEIEALVEDIPREKVLERAVELNARHGHQLTLSEKRNLTPRLWNNGSRDPEVLATLLGVSRQFVNKHTAEIREKQAQERNDKILNLYLRGYTQEEIAGKLTLARSTIATILADVKNATRGKIGVPDPPEIGDVWLFATCDDRYGLPGFPGRIPGQIVENLLHFYTEPFDLVVDPMAGSGTTLDVCLAMLRRCLAYDLAPVREDIDRYDIRESLPPRARACDFIFLDPPYYKKKDGSYSEGSLSGLPREEYLRAFAALAKECRKALRDGGRVALIMSNYLDDQDTHQSIWLWDYVDIFQKAGLTPAREVQCPLTSQSLHPAHVKDFQENRRMAKFTRSIVVFQR